MTSSRLFSILFNSFWLFAYYILYLKGNRSDAGSFSMLVKTFVEGPRLWGISSIKHYNGFCYVAELDEKFLSDQQGRSVLMLLEDGSNLPLPNSRDLNEIIKMGGGRYLHVENKLFFSPRDNADENHVKSRKYAVIETLVDDKERIEALLALNNETILKANPVLRMIEKIIIYFKDRIQFGGLADLGSKSYAIHKLTLNLSQWHLSNWNIEKLGIRYGKLFDDTLVTLKIENCSINGVDGFFNGILKLEIDHHYAIRPVSINLLKSDVLILNASFDWENKILEKAVIQTEAVTLLVEQLIVGCGGSEADYHNWLVSFINSISSNELSLNWTLDEESKQCLTRSLTSKTQAESFEIVVERAKENTMRISCFEKILSESEL